MKAKKHVAVLLAACAAAVVLVASLAGCASNDYKPTQKQSTVDSSSLVTPGTLTVGVNASNPPMAGQSTTYVGIDVDIAAAMADELGLKLSVVDVKSDGATALKNKQVDVVLGMDSSSTKDTSIWNSDAYMQTGIAIFSPSSTAAAPTTSDTTTFSAQVSSVSAWTIANQFGSNRVTNATDLSTTLSNAVNGTTNFAVADAVVGLYAAHTSGYKLSIIALATPATNYVAGVLSSNTSLQTAINTALKTVTNNGVVGVIQKKWLGTTVQLSNLTVTETVINAEKQRVAALEAAAAAAAEAAEAEANAESTNSSNTNTTTTTNTATNTATAA